MATSGIRKGRARFGDDVRERAKKFFESQKKGKTDKGAKPVTKATAPTPSAKKPAAKAAAKTAAKPARTSATTDSAKRMQTERAQSTRMKDMPPKKAAAKKTASSGAGNPGQRRRARRSSTSSAMSPMSSGVRGRGQMGRRMDASRTAGSVDTKMGPKTSFPRNVGTTDSKAAAARKEMMDKQGPLGDLMDKISGSRRSGVRSSVSRMKKGGMAKKGCKK